jgi:isopentenyl diphosphate isomerase/L-lactate dehydrogenase-like FMN-dependent dehydrogenase
VLPRIADAINGDVPLMLDSGIGRGTDVVKALLMGRQCCYRLPSAHVWLGNRRRR